MSYISMNNVKAHNNFLLEAQSRNLLLPDKRTTQVTENNNQISPNGTDKTIQEVWSKYSFKNLKAEPANNNFKHVSWAVENTTVEAMEEEDVSVKVEVEDNVKPTPSVEEKEEESSPSHHARRPMNAFLIFCKKHRPIVREKYPSLENRGVTKILGEWWALLDNDDKAPYKGLAKEYKDAFLSANPGFKWYKLPAPPLRNLTVRPSSTIKVQTPISSPNHNCSSIESEFTPGKLADESQLGGLTSLMNNNFSPTKMKLNENNNNNNNNEEKNDGGDEMYDNSLISPVNLMKTTILPPKPFKKRNFDQKYSDNNKSVARNLLMNEDISEEQQYDGSNMTNQDLLNKVVDKIFTKDDDLDGLRSARDLVRKSGRQCKGKLYEKFMVEGKLLGNKRDTKLTSQRFSDDKIENELRFKLETETPNLDHTIKRLAERTNMKNLIENQTEEKFDKPSNDRVSPALDNIGQNCENSTANNKQTNDFNLNLRINNLPSLSYDVFHQRKKESKKRKNRMKTDCESRSKVAKITNTQLVGSKKRKNKQSITHLEKKEENDNIAGDLLALATLAEVAANTQKIDDEKITTNSIA